MDRQSEMLIETRGLWVTYPGRGGEPPVCALSDANVGIRAGEAVGLVGESGCGKSTLGCALVGLVPPARGAVLFRGVRTDPMRRTPAFRRQVQMVFQDPYGSLNPRMTVGDCLAEVVRLHDPEVLAGDGNRSRRVEDRVAELADLVGLSRDATRRYPHEFSGGQRQRIGIARALAVRPSLVIADEPVSALDVSVQAQILNLLRDLRERLGLALLLIAHDLAVVQYLCERVVVMYLGRVVEEGSRVAVFSRPAHPYTRALMAAVPDVQSGLLARGAAKAGRGDTAAPACPPAGGCPYGPRCAQAVAACAAALPPLRQAGPAHAVRCFVAGASGATASGDRGIALPENP